MKLNILLSAWKFSGRLSSYSSKMSFVRRLKYISKVILNQKVASELFDNENAFVKNYLAERPEYYLMIEAPYINSRWSLEERVRKLISHLKLLEIKCSKFDFKFSENLMILDLSDFDISGYQIIIDKPIWFHREGTLSLNIFKKDIRIYTLTFAIEEDENNLIFLIGGIQGRNIDNILDEYRIFTKLFHGMRPRDFAIELLRILGSAVGISQILAISDECRHQRHAYFGKDTDRVLPANYNEIWKDRGGIQDDFSTYTLPLGTSRDIDAVAPKKRSMYKKRFELLRQIEQEIISSFPAFSSTPAIEAK